jgi:hypothetical protein|tara:strand:- start:178 stop:393 length:216 start_codon:yes stop_codon:yes gene_type:complete
MKDEVFNDSILDIVTITDLEDGSANVTIDVSEEFLTIYRNKTGKKRATKKGVAKFIEENLNEYLAKKIKEK